MFRPFMFYALVFLLRIAHEVFHDLENSEKFEGDELQFAIKMANLKFEKAYRITMMQISEQTYDS